VSVPVFSLCCYSWTIADADRKSSTTVRGKRVPTNAERIEKWDRSYLEGQDRDSL
jgi:hypothetical protein